MIEEILKELMDKRNKLNKIAEDHRRNRDKFNSNTKQWAGSRSTLNEHVKECLKNASDHKRDRDDFNREVQEAKKEREKLNKEYNEN